MGETGSPIGELICEQYMLSLSRDELSLIGQTLLYSLALSLVTGLVEQRKHVLLISFHTRLVEGIHTEEVAADATGNLEEVDKLSDVILVEGRNMETQIGYAPST